MIILQTIFSGYYEHIIYELHTIHSVVENVERMIDCGDPSKGGAMFGCAKIKPVLPMAIESKNNRRT